MFKNEIIDWVHQEFDPVQLATVDTTIQQIVDNAIRYWNTHSAFPIVRMFDASPATIRLQLTPDYKTVVTVYPATTPDWILQNFPLWSLLGITIIDNLTSDLVYLSEAYRNYRYYIGTDFHWHYEKSDDPAVGGSLFINQMPSPTTQICVVGTKRIISDSVEFNTTGTSGTFEFVPIESSTFTLTNGSHTYTDNGAGVLVSSQSGYSGTIDYDTGVWTVTGWVGDTDAVATYDYEENITSEYILQWLLYYVKALVKLVEGNALRKAGSINIRNDGDIIYNEGKIEKEDLEKKLSAEGRWLTFAKRF